jgi:hypothetical protein
VTMQIGDGDERMTSRRSSPVATGSMLLR